MTLFDRLTEQGSVLRAALNGTMVRNDVIVNNIANADVAGFKASRVDFEESLKHAVANTPRNQRRDLSGVVPTVRRDNPNHSFRLDHNNVDIEREMVALYQNAMRFETMIASVQNNSRRLSLALGGR